MDLPIDRGRRSSCVLIEMFYRCDGCLVNALTDETQIGLLTDLPKLYFTVTASSEKRVAIVA